MIGHHVWELSDDPDWWICDLCGEPAGGRTRRPSGGRCKAWDDDAPPPPFGSDVHSADAARRIYAMREHGWVARLRPAHCRAIKRHIQWWVAVALLPEEAARRIVAAARTGRGARLSAAEAKPVCLPRAVQP